MQYFPRNQHAPTQQVIRQQKQMLPQPWQLKDINQHACKILQKVAEGHI